MSEVAPAPSAAGGAGEPGRDRAPVEAGSAPWLTFPRLLFLLLVGPLLLLAYRTGSKIAAEREAWRLGRELSGITPDGRPDARVLLHLRRGSGALLEVLLRKVREGPFEERAGVARALGCSGRIECLPELVRALRDGCVDPETIVIGGRPELPLRVLPPDELAFSQEGHARALVEAVAAKTEDPFARAWAKTYLVALDAVEPAKTPLDGDVARLLASDDPVLRDRAARLATWALHAQDLALGPDAQAPLLALAAPRPSGRLAAALLGRYFPGATNESIRALSDELGEADVILARDPVAIAHASRALARGDVAAARTLVVLAARDPQALEALVAAVAPPAGAPPVDPDARAAAIAALESSSDPRAQAALSAAQAQKR